MRNKSFNVFVFFFFLGVTIVFAQNECECQALLSLNHTKLVDSIKLTKTINALKISSDKNCKFKALILEFENYKKRELFDEALITLQRQEELIDELKCKNQFKFDLLRNRIGIYREINDLSNLSRYAFDALKEARKTQDPEREIEAIQNIVFVFTRLNEDEKNWKYIKRAQELIKGLEDKKETIKYYRWLALEYETKYTLIERETLIDTALIFINKAKNNALKYKMNDELIEAYKVLEGCSYHRKDFEKAVMYIDSAIHYSKLNNLTKYLGPIYIYKSWDLLELKKFSEVEKSLDSAKKYNTLNGGAKMSFYHEVSDIYENMGQLDKALINYKKYTTLKDSIVNSSTLEKVNDMEQKYNKVANENKIVQLEKTKQFYSFLIIGSLFALLILFLIFRQRSLKNKQKIMLTEQRLNKARINPHFFFNAMASLQNLSLKEGGSKTTLFISRFAKIMRQSLENTYDDLITLEGEIDFLKQYLDVQKLRYPNKFDYNFFVDDTLEVNELKIPSMIIQPFIENSIEHGFKNINYKGELNLKFNDQGENLEIVVKDNGIGLDFDKTEKAYKSRAMQIIKDRLYLLNAQYKSKANYSVTILDEYKGFEIAITLPKLYDI